jgi:hypothetical protein
MIQEAYTVKKRRTETLSSPDPCSPHPPLSRLHRLLRIAAHYAGLALGNRLPIAFPHMA